MIYCIIHVVHYDVFYHLSLSYFRNLFLSAKTEKYYSFLKKLAVKSLKITQGFSLHLTAPKLKKLRVDSNRKNFVSYCYCIFCPLRCSQINFNEIENFEKVVTESETTNLEFQLTLLSVVHSRIKKSI